jgi:hypothetical protein
MIKPTVSDERLQALRRAHSGAVKSGYVGVMEAMKRIELQCAKGTLETQYVGRSGPGERRTYTLAPVPMDVVWDICLRQGTYETECGSVGRGENLAHMSQSSGRLATGLTHEHMRAKESRHTYKLAEGAANAYIGKTRTLTKNTARLKYAVTELLQSRTQVGRDAMICYIVDLCETEGIRWVPWFLHSPTSIQSQDHAYIFRDFLFSLFSISSRAFKKYYLMPKIKQLGKLWKLDPPPEKAESFDTILEKLESQIYAEMIEEHERQVNLEKQEKAKHAKSLEEQASRINQMFLVRPKPEEYAKMRAAKQNLEDWEKENERKIAACKRNTDK